MPTNLGSERLGLIKLGTFSDPLTQHVRSTLSLSQDIYYEVPNVPTVVSTYSPSQTIDVLKVLPRLVVQGITWTHSISLAGSVFNRTVSQTYTPSQTIVGHYIKPVSHTLTLSQLISYVKQKSVVHVIPWQQELLCEMVYGRSVNTIYPVYQTLAHNKILNLSVESELNLSQTITEYRVLGVEQFLNLTQTIVGIASKGVSSTLNLSQAISYNHTHVAAVNSLLAFNQTVGMNRSLGLRVKHAFGMNSFVRQYRLREITVSQALNLSQEIRFNVYNESVSHTYTPTQTVAYTPVYPRGVTSNLVLGQTIGLNTVMSRSVENVLVFLPQRVVYVGMGDTQYYTIDNIQYSLIRGRGIKPHCVLTVPNAAITLPSPNWGDTEAYDGVFTIRRSMNNIPYTYVRNLSLRKLSLPWTLSKRKAWELREFLLNNNTKLMTLTTWKGDKWFLNLVTNPFELAVRGRYYNENEKVDVDLEFEGLKVM